MLIKATIFIFILKVMKKHFPSSSFRNYNVINIREAMISSPPNIFKNKLKILALQQKI
jgi:hypothetical protein